ncbi:MAG TPA: Uma2 family endonuclease [Tepidiformaceae bacterium]|nr:Uma2 family endonuclease [Tepidiformaceae bacterium]
MPVSEKTFEQLALEDDETTWELVCGRLREKPRMSMEHNSVARRLGFLLQSQLDWREYEVSVDAGYVRWTEANYFGPDVFVIPAAYMERRRGQRGLETYDEPLPFVAEVWSPSTGGYDVDTKFPEYMARGDLEIWRVHPYEKSLTAWRRQADGTYAESHYTSGVVHVESLPGVAIVLDRLFR